MNFEKALQSYLRQSRNTLLISRAVYLVVLPDTNDIFYLLFSRICFPAFPSSCNLLFRLSNHLSSLPEPNQIFEENGNTDISHTLIFEMECDAEKNSYTWGRKRKEMVLEKMYVLTQHHHDSGQKNASKNN